MLLARESRQERKAEEERRRLHDEAMKRAERDARDKIEAELKALDERKKREAEAAAAEAAAQGQNRGRHEGGGRGEGCC